MRVFHISLSFFLPLLAHALVGLTAGITGIVAFNRPKRRGGHPRRGTRYLWAYTLLFLTAIILTIQRWQTDAYLFFLAMIGYGLAPGGYAARRFRREHWMAQIVGKQWIIVHIVGMIGSYIVLWTAFYVDNGHLIPLVKQLPTWSLWTLPTLIGLPFMAYSISRFACPHERVSSTLKHKASH